jgi:VWA domain-containing protein
MSTFTAETYQNEYLVVGGTEVNAIVTVTASGAQVPARPADAAEIVILDVSGSMADPRAKLHAAKKATAVAIDLIRDGVMFGVIAGSETARSVYPASGALVPASASTRDEAKREVRRLKVANGTAIGTWLALANQLFAASRGAICHAILLTDGQDEHETPEELEAVLSECEGRFQCDCRGVGADWEVNELGRIATVLLGTVDIVTEPADLEADFRSLIERAMGRATGSVSLRLWTPQGASTAFVKQVSPAIENLTSRAARVDALTAEYPTGAWGDESRDYHVCINVQPRQLGEEMLAGRVSLVVDEEVVSQALIRAIWTDDEQLSTHINREVAHYTGQEELREVIQEGLKARKAGDEETATVKLGRAVQLAAANGNKATFKLLSGVVDVQDPITGTVRLKPNIDDADEMALDTRSTKTVRVQKPRP